MKPHQCYVTRDKSSSSSSMVKQLDQITYISFSHLDRLGAAVIIEETELTKIGRNKGRMLSISSSTSSDLKVLVTDYIFNHNMVNGTDDGLILQSKFLSSSQRMVKRFYSTFNLIFIHLNLNQTSLEESVSQFGIVQKSLYFMKTHRSGNKPTWEEETSLINDERAE